MPVLSDYRSANYDLFICYWFAGMLSAGMSHLKDKGLVNYVGQYVMHGWLSLVEPGRAWLSLVELG